MVELFTENSCYPLWYGFAWLMPDVNLRFKLVVRASDGTFRWEDNFPNRAVDVWSTRMELVFQFDKPEYESFEIFSFSQGDLVFPSHTLRTELPLPCDAEAVPPLAVLSYDELDSPPSQDDLIMETCLTQEWKAKMINSTVWDSSDSDVTTQCPGSDVEEEN